MSCSSCVRIFSRLAACSRVSCDSARSFSAASMAACALAREDSSWRVRSARAAAVAAASGGGFFGAARPGAAGLHEHVGEREEFRELRFCDEAEVENDFFPVEGERGLELRRIEASADEAHGRAALVEELDGEVELAHLGLVGEGVAAGE